MSWGTTNNESVSPSLSVVIIALNEEHTIGRLLDQISSQTFQPTQLIVSDSKSTDATETICKQHPVRWSTLHFHQCNVTKWPAYGRNRGAELATGEWIVFFDADTQLPDNLFIQQSMDYLLAHHAQFGYCTLRPSTTDRKSKAGIALTNRFIRTHAWRRPIVPGGCIFVQRDVHQAIGGFDETIYLGEDSLYGRTAKKIGATLAVLPQPFVFDMRRIHQQWPWTMARRYLKGYRLMYQRNVRFHQWSKKVTYDFGTYTKK